MSMSFMEMPFCMLKDHERHRLLDQAINTQIEIFEKTAKIPPPPPSTPVATTPRHTDYVQAFIELTGFTHLYCNHCRKETQIVLNWRKSVSTRYIKYLKNNGKKPITIPKTCDRMKQTNDRCNPINNQVYQRLRNPNINVDIKLQAIQYRKRELETLHIEINPFKYVANFCEHCSKETYHLYNVCQTCLL